MKTQRILPKIGPTHRLAVAWNTWEPGLNGNGSTSGGGAIWTRYLWKQLDRHHNIGVVNISGRPNLVGTNFDAAVFCWRWNFPRGIGYDERADAYEKQMHLLDECYRAGIPIIVHDQDHKIGSDLTHLRSLGAHIYEPSLAPRDGVGSLLFPYPFGRPIAPKMSDYRTRLHSMSYVGNNYERYPQFVEYFGGEKWKTPPTPFYSGDFVQWGPSVWGNWLESSPLRETPERVMRDNPNVHFLGRLDQSMVQEVMAASFATIHFAKPSYNSAGFVTIRWAEAVAAGCIGAIPEEFNTLGQMKELVVSPSTIEAWTDRVVRDYEFRMQLMEMQTDFVLGTMTVAPWASTLRGVK